MRLCLLKLCCELRDHESSLLTCTLVGNSPQYNTPFRTLYLATQQKTAQLQHLRILNGPFFFTCIVFWTYHTMTSCHHIMCECILGLSLVLQATPFPFHSTDHICYWHTKILKAIGAVEQKRSGL